MIAYIVGFSFRLEFVGGESVVSGEQRRCGVAHTRESHASTREIRSRNLT
jgi:hypothetical protein